MTHIAQTTQTPFESVPSPIPASLIPTHAVFDIESLGTIPGSVVLSIAVVLVTTPITKVDKSFEFTFNQSIDLDSSLRRGLTIDANTLKWWLRQSVEAQGAAFGENQEVVPGLSEVLLKLSTFLRPWRGPVGRDNLYVWGYGSHFDISLVEALYRAMGPGAEAPWKYQNVRCLRTLCKTLPYDKSLVQHNACPHDALSDAIHQAQNLQALYLSNPSLRL